MKLFVKMMFWVLSICIATSDKHRCLKGDRCVIQTNLQQLKASSLWVYINMYEAQMRFYTGAHKTHTKTCCFSHTVTTSLSQPSDWLRICSSWKGRWQWLKWWEKLTLFPHHWPCRSQKAVRFMASVQSSWGLCPPQRKFSFSETTGSNGADSAFLTPARGVSREFTVSYQWVIRTFILHSFNKPSTNFQLVCAITAGERSDNLGCLRFFPKLRASCIYFYKLKSIFNA